ncbi:MAG: 3-isopropylmalate dehydratase small subunit [Nitrososphaerota archaeon]|nr:3-isopropylmalate dehydratase small subunit [Candidatus Bathyarchaeota archaeon]MCX8162235.1 3-isopropylmalate dehydratase small subunit [Candidatus Bathyarchaeota archaeon]MDW8062517.1 3-isopropylmalate dehydratase small subunit [Nitrososphaerota archaeon]
MRIEGIVVKVGDHIDTDVIIPGRYLGITDPSELGKHALEGLDPSFPARLKPGVILVAGRNFGCGSSREEAPVALKAAGVRCIVAESFARIFYRNAINVGLPIVECSGIHSYTRDGDRLSVDLSSGVVEAVGRQFRFKPLPDFILRILEDGGLTNYIRKLRGLPT